MEAAKATAFTPENWVYKADNGRFVHLNPNGPNSQPPAEFGSADAPFYKAGWGYTSDPTRPSEPGIENKFDHMLFFTGLGQGMFNVAKAGASNAASTAFATESDQAVFWAGREEAKAAATAFATANGGRTISMTRGGQALSFLDAVPYQVTRPLWNWGSRKFAEGASGNVNVFLNGVAKPTSIWTRTELPTLMRNPNITTIAPRSVP